MHQINKRAKFLLISLPILAILLFLTLLSSSCSSSSSLTNNVTETEKLFNNRAIPHIHVHQNYQIAQSACDGTRFSDLCVSTLLTIPNLRGKLLTEIITAAVNLTVAEVVSSEKNCTRISRKIPNMHPIDRRALEDCLELLDDTISELEIAGADLGDGKLVPRKYHDLQTLLSGAMTNQATCLDGFAHSKGNIRPYFEDRLETISHHVSNILAMLKKLPGEMGFSTEGNGYRIRGGFPTWVTGKERRLLQAPVNGTRFDLLVAKDGSGNFTTIESAVEAAPNSSATRFVIRIKAGAYFENLEIPKKKTNLMFVGDGIGKTFIKGNRSVVDGWTTFRSATVAVVGKGFIAKGISFENYAGAIKHQAVALRSGSDLSAFYQCSFIGYQDTLYVHSLRQFYRECDVYGTVDFIFGNAAVVFQNCNLYARKPNENQKNIFTAQGRADPNQNTGISIMNSKVAAAADLIPVQSTFKNYLGRPWKEYSRTVFLSSEIDNLIDPAGWLEWSGEFALSTLFYGEYNNRGPGSNTSARVKWPGYRGSLNATEASKFTVGHFIQGGEWLTSYGSIPFYLNLTASG